MDNHTIVKTLGAYVDLMTLHDENEFKVKSYSNALFNLERYNESLYLMKIDELEEIQGVGKSTAKSIDELIQKGEIEALEVLKEKTPAGIMDMLKIKGLGTKKIKTIWQQMGIEDTTALLEAIEKGELSKIKGFGEKTAQNIKEVLLFLEANKYKLYFAEAEKIATNLCETIRKKFPDNFVEISGEVRRKLEIVNTLTLVVGTDAKKEVIDYLNTLPSLIYDEQHSGPQNWRGTLQKGGTPVIFKFSVKKNYFATLLSTSSAPVHLSQIIKESLTLNHILLHNTIGSEEEAYHIAGVPFIAPEIREGQFEWEAALKNELPKLVEMNDLKGVLHNHSTWSDGKHSLEEMAYYCQELGYNYLGISDHSTSAFYYANGLNKERVAAQHLEIDQLNAKMGSFKIFKGIESDILADGRLDYDDDVLASFDFIVSSIHSGLSMDKNKATERLLTAIANPFTTMLGHPTGRLLLQRKGYPIDHKTIIDACAEYGVIIEI
ncbi:MAG: helix-hairpin-helix domain-containing protein, partial [Cyclobacteriaceae bacterium]|nr:helix-hairpin-helix domain-containing protein [Cyclobacteriaceae bacterium]